MARGTRQTGLWRGALLAVLICFPVRAADRVTAGFGQDPPLHYRDAHGRAAGFMVDAVNEAARRDQIRVIWRPVAGSQDIEPALQAGRIDLFPSAIVTPLRHSRFWVSDPWWTEDLSLLVRADAGEMRRGHRVGSPGDPAFGRLCFLGSGVWSEPFT